MIACGSCKQLNDESSRACRFCGTNLLYGKPIPSSSPQAPPPRPFAPPPPRPQPQPAPLPPPAAPMGYYAPPAPPYGGYHCLQCGTAQPPQIIRKMSQEGLIVLIVLVFSGVCLPFFWIGLLMKEDIYVCPQCGRKAN